AEVQFGVVEDPPSARAVAAAVKGADELAAEHRSRVRMRQSRPRARIELAVEHLGDHVLGHGYQVVVGCTNLEEAELGHEIDGCERATSRHYRLPRKGRATRITP